MGLIVFLLALFFQYLFIARLLTLPPSKSEVYYLLFSTVATCNSALLNINHCELCKQPPGKFAFSKRRCQKAPPRMNSEQILCRSKKRLSMFHRDQNSHTVNATHEYKQSAATLQKTQQSTLI